MAELGNGRGAAAGRCARRSASSDCRSDALAQGWCACDPLPGRRGRSKTCGPSVGRGFGGADSQGDGARRAASVAWVDVASVRLAHALECGASEREALAPPAARESTEGGGGAGYIGGRAASASVPHPLAAHVAPMARRCRGGAGAWVVAISGGADGMGGWRGAASRMIGDDDDDDDDDGFAPPPPPYPSLPPPSPSSLCVLDPGGGRRRRKRRRRRSGGLWCWWWR